MFRYLFGEKKSKQDVEKNILHKDVLHKHPVSYFVKRHNHKDPVYTNMKG